MPRLPRAIVYLRAQATQSARGWTCYEYLVPAGLNEVTLSGSTFIDELRLYPAGAQMNTYAYGPAGLQSTSDARKENTHYEYDNFQRLLNVKDAHGNIVKNYNYKYVNEPAYYSAAAKGKFVRDNCGSDSLGTRVVYTVAAGAYISPVSQQYADSLAINDVITNGQAFANANGDCNIIVYYSNSADSTFTNQPCRADSTGSRETYALNYGAYTSLISQAVADSLDWDDIRRNGQAHADSVGACITNNPVIQYFNFSLSNGTDANYQAAFSGMGQDLEFNMTAHSDTTVQVPADTYSLDVYTNGTYTSRTFTLVHAPR